MDIPPPAQAPRPALAPHPAAAHTPTDPAPAATASHTPAPTEPVPSAGPATPEPKREAPQKRLHRQFDDVYITSFAGQVTYVHVQKDARLNATIGNYHTQPQGEHWVRQALAEAARLCRTRSTIRIHTTEPEITAALRDLRGAPRDEYGDLRATLARSGKTLVLARPERESPIWRDLMKLMKDGKMPTPSPLVTYLVHTAAVTDYEHVYTGVVMVGLGTVVVHATSAKGDNLVDAELDMMDWVLRTGGGGGRIDVHHSSDGARRIWEQADHLAQQDGTDALGRSGTRLRSLAREAYRLRTQIQPARAPHPLFDRFARIAASSEFAGNQL